ncbi:MAG TPA: hypothetical protein VJQ47_10110 [Steroidobacteraceae bacterium]|nr:hypothetical protein [Steroidobacteraceae bacterium]
MARTSRSLQTLAIPIRSGRQRALQSDSKPAHGLLWTSRQDDEAKALVLFGDRITESDFRIEVDREQLYQGAHLDRLLALVEHVGITQVIGL